MAAETLGHLLLVSFPGQGHVNPLLRLGKMLASRSFLVTFSTAEITGKQMRKANNITDELTPFGDGFIRFEFFEDGWENDDPRREDLDQYLTQLELVGKQVIPQMIRKNAEQGRPVSCLINNPFIPWVTDVATSLGLPSAMLWVQSCACFAAYYHYHHGSVPFPDEEHPEIDVQLPCMPLLKYDEVPSFLYPTTPYAFLRRAILGQYKNLDKPFCILMETFEELEPELIQHMSEIFPIKAVGPLFRNPKVPKTTVQGDFWKADDCIEWLDTKPPSSVVYVSFGSVVELKQDQWNEIAHGLLNSGVSFLLVMKTPPQKDAGQYHLHVLPDGFLEKAGNKGIVVQWTPQEKVLAHPSVACFVTHCGWNSSMEALTSGMPVVAFPQWGDQVTNAKYLVDIFKVGARMCRGEAENRLITRDEIEKCLLEATAGPKAVEMKENAMKWKEAAEAAVADGGSSDRNIRCFIDEMSLEIARQCNGGFNGVPKSVVVNSNEKVVELAGSSA
ncbi:GLUCOSYL/GLUCURONOSYL TRANSFERASES [Salix purpurea]|uniref:Glycosyltransferase n=1 Tax=Salix purpurea TaxID=77065 RepID=A0A9Q0PQH3_SALPP|nr:GLUCOSYL/GLUCURONOSYL TRANSFERASES [Salix purpurea]